MNLLTIAQLAAPYIGIPKPVTTADQGPDSVKLVTFANAAGLEMARRFDWAALTKKATITGTGSAARIAMPTDYQHLTAGLSIVHNGSPVRGGISDDEWMSLDFSEGDPRYFRMFGNSIELYPYLAVGDTINISYQSKWWVKGNKERLTVDTDEPLIPDRAIVMGAVWRFMRSAGKDYSDYMAEYESLFQDFAQQENMDR
jgi:hypothetical protein